MAFDKEKHANDLLSAEGIIAQALDVAEIMSLAEIGLEQCNYTRLSVGIFGLMQVALNEAHIAISEAETIFRRENGLYYPYQADDLMENNAI